MKIVMTLLLCLLSNLATAQKLEPCNQGEGKSRMRKSIDDQLIGLMSYANSSSNITIWNLKYTDLMRIAGVARSADIVVTYNLTVKHISGATQTDFEVAQFNVDENCNAQFVRSSALKN